MRAEVGMGMYLLGYLSWLAIALKRWYLPSESKEVTSCLNMSIAGEFCRGSLPWSCTIA